MNRQERELSESLIKMYVAIVNEDAINKRLDELNAPKVDENIGGSKSTFSNTAENAILKRLDDKRLNRLVNIKTLVESKLKSMDDIEKNVINMFYSNVSNREGRRPSVEVAESLLLPEEFCKKTRKKLINLVKNELFY